MKAKIDLSHTIEIGMNAVANCYWECKRNGKTVIPFEFYNIWKQGEIINLVPALLTTFGDYKFLNPVNNKIYWIRKELIRPIYEMENDLFEI